MARVAIVTDSSACLPAELQRAHRIITVPLTFLFDGELHYDGRLGGREFYSLLRSARRFPTTSSPAPAAFVEALRQASAEAESALCVTLPSTYSGTYSSALNAAELARTELPGFTVRVVDSHCLAMCHGFAVLQAARAAQAGAGLDEAEAAVREVASRAQLMGALDTLRYLAKSGRLPLVFHWATSLLQIKPILIAEGEKVLAGGRVRTMSRALDRLMTLIEQRTGEERPLHMAVMHADAAVTATAFAERVRERFEPEEMLVTEFTSVMGAHTGPGFVGVAFFAGGPAAVSGGSGAGDDAERLEASLTGIPEASASPALVIVSGLPGSGKSHFSRTLCQRYPLAHLNSDALRRALFAQPTHAAAESERLFAAIHVLLERLLSRGVSALLDATNLREAHRGPLYAIAERTGARLVIVKTEAPEEVALGRLGIRGGGTAAGDASDADAAVYDRMKGEAEPISRPHIAVDTSRDIEPALEAVLQRLNAAPRA